MDSYPVPVQGLRLGQAVTSLLLLATGPLLLTACGPRKAVTKQQVADRLKKEAREVGPAAGTLEMHGKQSTFVVDDKNGKRLLEAKVDQVIGTMLPGVGPKGPLKFQQTKAKLYQDGKPSMDLVTPEATWDGKQLYTEKTAHGVTADGKTVIDAQKAVWTSENGHLALEQAKLQGLKDGKTDFTAEGPRATVLNNVANMPVRSTSRNAKGQTLSADRMRWNLRTGKLRADGNVVITEEGTRVSGEHLDADTKLNKGRLTGGTQVRMRRMPVKKKPG